MQLIEAGGAEVVHDVGSFQLYPLMELVILQESAIIFSFANYSYEEILSTYGFVDEVMYSKLILHKIATISNLVHDSCQGNATMLGFP
jgi:hypothetical protein